MAVTKNRRSKFGNVKTNGYASKKESRRARQLMILESKGLISNLEEQHEFELIPKQDGERAVKYIADFVYVDRTTKPPKIVVEDVKGRRTKDYVIKRKLMLFMHGVRVKET